MAHSTSHQFHHGSTWFHTTGLTTYGAGRCLTPTAMARWSNRPGGRFESQRAGDAVIQPTTAWSAEPWKGNGGIDRPDQSQPTSTAERIKDGVRQVSWADPRSASRLSPTRRTGSRLTFASSRPPHRTAKLPSASSRTTDEPRTTQERRQSNQAVGLFSFIIRGAKRKGRTGEGDAQIAREEKRAQMRAKRKARAKTRRGPPPVGHMWRGLSLSPS